jgi:hypothetical protein
MSIDANIHMYIHRYENMYMYVCIHVNIYIFVVKYIPILINVVRINLPRVGPIRPAELSTASMTPNKPPTWRYI